MQLKATSYGSRVLCPSHSVLFVKRYTNTHTLQPSGPKLNIGSANFPLSILLYIRQNRVSSADRNFNIIYQVQSTLRYRRSYTLDLYCYSIQTMQFKSFEFGAQTKTDGQRSRAAGSSYNLESSWKVGKLETDGKRWII